MNLPSQTELLLVGAGIVGCSLAYHLALKGFTEVVVLDKGDLSTNDGSTSHAPGGIHVTSPSRMMTDFAVYSTDLYASLDPPGQVFRGVGGIEFAYTPERLEELKRRHGIAQASGIEAHLLEPERCQEMVPILDPRVILGGFHVPRDANVAASPLSAALAEPAKNRGVVFAGNCPVERLLTEDGRVIGVVTREGEIRAERVVVCSNIWAPILTRQVGLELPLLAAQHQYAVTTPLPELAPYADQEVKLPTLRHQDFALYYRQHHDCWGIGNYRHEPLLVAPEAVGKTALREFTRPHFEQSWTASQELFPALRQAEIANSFNGMFAFTIDGFPILGPTAVSGLWTAVGVWITHAGGVGKAMAEWLLEGAPKTDYRWAEARRFHSFQLTPHYIQTRCHQNYAEVYDIHHPQEPLARPRDLRRTPFHRQMLQLDAHLVESAGWEMPLYYQSNEALLERYFSTPPKRDSWGARFWSPIQAGEHLAVREQVGLFNLGALAPIEVRGPNSLNYLERLCTNRLDREPGSVVYTAMLDSGGGIRADVTVVRWERERFWVINGGALAPRDLGWLESHQDSGVELRPLESAYTCLGLWGPAARRLLQKLTSTDLSHQAFPYYRAQRLAVAGRPVEALRLSYAGELGWELYCPSELGEGLWDALWEAGQDSSIVAAGSGAFDSLRLEKAYRLWGQDMTTEHTPRQAGLSFVLADKPFLGREAMEARPVDARLTSLIAPNPSAFLMGGEPIECQGETVGYITSANFGHSIGKLVALGWLQPDCAGPLQARYFGEPVALERHPGVFFDPKGSRMKA